MLCHAFAMRLGKQGCSWKVLGNTRASLGVLGGRGAPFGVPGGSLVVSLGSLVGVLGAVGRPVTPWEALAIRLAKKRVKTRVKMNSREAASKTMRRQNT